MQCNHREREREREKRTGRPRGEVWREEARQAEGGQPAVAGEAVPDAVVLAHVEHRHPVGLRQAHQQLHGQLEDPALHGAGPGPCEVAEMLPLGVVRKTKFRD